MQENAIDETEDVTFDPFEDAAPGGRTLILDGPPECQAALFAAIAAAQCDMKDPSKNATGRIGKGGAETFRYADLQAVLEAVRPPLAKAGVALLQAFHGQRGGGTLSTILAGHGAMLRADIQIPRYGADEAKELGAYLTYIKRYAVQSIGGVAGDTDLDETGSRGGPQRQAPAPRAAQPRQDAPRPQTQPRQDAPRPQAAPKPQPPPRAKSEPPPPPPEPEPEPEEPEAEEAPPEPQAGPLTKDTQDAIKRVASVRAAGDMRKAIECINAFAQKAIGGPALRMNPQTKKHGWAAELREADGLAILDLLTESP